MKPAESLMPMRWKWKISPRSTNWILFGCTFYSFSHVFSFTFSLRPLVSHENSFGWRRIDVWQLERERCNSNFRFGFSFSLSVFPLLFWELCMYLCRLYISNFHFSALTSADNEGQIKVEADKASLLTSAATSASAVRVLVIAMEERERKIFPSKKASFHANSTATATTQVKHWLTDIFILPSPPVAINNLCQAC